MSTTPPAPPAPQPTGYWWCDWCAAEVDPRAVTFEEFHDGCGRPVRGVDVRTVDDGLTAGIERAAAAFAVLAPHPEVLVRVTELRAGQWLAGPHGPVGVTTITRHDYDGAAIGYTIEVRHPIFAGADPAELADHFDAIEVCIGGSPRVARRMLLGPVTDLPLALDPDGRPLAGGAAARAALLCDITAESDEHGEPYVIVAAVMDGTEVHAWAAFPEAAQAMLTEIAATLDAPAAQRLSVEPLCVVQLGAPESVCSWLDDVPHEHEPVDIASTLVRHMVEQGVVLPADDTVEVEG